MITPAEKRAVMKPLPSCQAPDRDVPALTCGYPLPCPHHNFRRVIKVAVLVQPAKKKRRRASQKTR